jgi:hypothetical protein
MDDSARAAVRLPGGSHERSLDRTKPPTVATVHLVMFPRRERHTLNEKDFRE